MLCVWILKKGMDPYRIDAQTGDEMAVLRAIKAYSSLQLKPPSFFASMLENEYFFL